jgi:hypothetical protein
MSHAESGSQTELNKCESSSCQDEKYDDRRGTVTNMNIIECQLWNSGSYCVPPYPPNSESHGSNTSHFKK